MTVFATTGGKKKASGQESWASKSSKNQLVSGGAAAAGKGAGQVLSSSGWGGGKSVADASEGSITNSKHRGNVDEWADSWGSQKSGKTTKKFGTTFANTDKVSTSAKAAHQGKGLSSTVANKSANSSSKGTDGSAVDTQIRRNFDNWSKNNASYQKGKTKVDFGQTSATKKQASGSVRGIGYGGSSANAKASVDKTMVSAEGQTGAQSNTNLKHSANSWSDSFGSQKKGGVTEQFGNKFNKDVSFNSKTSAFGVGNAEIKGMISEAVGSKTIASGQQGSGSNADFKGDRKSWSDGWSKSKGGKVDIAAIELPKPASIAMPPAPKPPTPAAAAAPAVSVAPDTKVGAAEPTPQADTGEAAKPAETKQESAGEQQQAAKEEQPAKPEQSEGETPATEAPATEAPAAEAQVGDVRQPENHEPAAEQPAEVQPTEEAATEN